MKIWLVMIGWVFQMICLTVIVFMISWSSLHEFSARSSMHEFSGESYMESILVRHKVAQTDAGNHYGLLDVVRPRRGLELSVPFYVYDDLEEIRALNRNCSFAFEGEFSKGGHTGEYWAYEQLKNHRWRVYDPNDALLFYIPIFLGAVLSGDCGIQTPHDLIKKIEKEISDAKQYKLNSGNDHFFIGTSHSVHMWFRTENPSFWKNLIWVRYMTGYEESFCQVLSPFSTLREFAPENLSVQMEDENVTDYINKRPYNLFFMGRIWYEHHRGGYHSRRDMFSSLPGFMSPNILISTTSSADGSELTNCTETIGEREFSFVNYLTGEPAVLEGCRLGHSSDFYAKASQRAKFHLMIRGDDWASQRLYDSLASGSIPVVLSDGILDKVLPFGCDVDWDNIIIRIPQQQFQSDPHNLLRRLIPDWNTVEGRNSMSRKLTAIREARKYLMWADPKSLTAETVLYQIVRKCMPEAYILRKQYSSETSRNFKPLRTLQELKCVFRDYSKTNFRTGRHGWQQAPQFGWNCDD